VREEEITASARIDDSMATPTATFGEVPRQDYSHPSDTCVRGWKFIEKNLAQNMGKTASVFRRAAFPCRILVRKPNPITWMIPTVP
jgi:hypothetical protein